MQSADLRNRNDAPARWRLPFPRVGAFVVEGLMRAGGVVVREVTAQQASEVPFVEHDDVIEALPSDRADDAFRVAVLPRRPRRCLHRLYVNPGDGGRLLVRYTVPRLRGMMEPVGEIVPNSRLSNS